MTNNEDSRLVGDGGSRSFSPALIWLGYVVFVVYGSLVPLEFRSMSLADAWAAFQKTPYLSLGINARADWVANGVLYFPLGFLTAFVLSNRFRSFNPVVAYTVAGLFAVTLAVSVEFVQLFFPPRTVSLNDIFAECAGFAVGMVCAMLFSNWAAAVLASFAKETQWLTLRVLQAYALGYLVFAFFPFDLLLSLAEMQAKIGSSSWGWFLADGARSLGLVVLQAAAEAVLTVPLGMLLVQRARQRRAKGSLGLAAALAIGLLIGVAIEFAQFFIASGISQGVSVVTRMLGFAGGCALGQWHGRPLASDVAGVVRRWRFPLVIAYALFLMVASGWFTKDWQGLDAALQAAGRVNLIPFYYHYFTSESRALFSFAAIGLAYSPVPILVWACKRQPGIAAAVSSGIAAIIEAGKLFLVAGRPDPTNILLALAVGWFGAKILSRLFPLQAAPQAAVNAGVSDIQRTSSTSTLILLFAVLVPVLFWLVNFPTMTVWVGLALLGCGVLVWHRPVLILAISAGALPAFDLAPWSGRFFLDEFDALLFVMVSIGLIRVTAMRQPHRSSGDFLIRFAAAAVIASLAISAARGMTPWVALDANAFSNYYSPYNALRIFKGAVWACLLYVLARRLSAQGHDVRRPFAWGMVAGLAATVVWVLWERAAFSGLWNYAAGYRVTGPFSSIHIGGAYIECFIAVSVPFLMVLMAESRTWLMRVAGAALLLGATYAVMVTYSRNGYFAYAVAVAIASWAVLRTTRSTVRSTIGFAALALAMVLVALPIYRGDFAQARVARLQADLNLRQTHWAEALDMRDASWATTAFGMGLGKFPITSYWHSGSQPRAATYQFVSEADNTYLRLGAGDSMYFEQLVRVDSGKRYTLSVDVRSSQPKAVLTVPICEKWMLASYSCIWLSLDVESSDGVWRTVTKEFDATALPSHPWYASRPIKLALYYAIPNSTIDIDNLRLVDASGESVLQNGDFQRGMDHWFFSTDGHLQWHIKSLLLGVLFDQGWFGLIAIAGLLLVASANAARRAHRGDLLAGAALAATLGFLVTAVFDTLIDTPRFLMLLLMLFGLSAFSRPTSRVAQS
ncbi:VanZ family protein [Comamonadaceae bacterium G21597-S1]|nr:VanZ family protein [Comamonadaceae bacterium G21597-S1]